MTTTKQQSTIILGLFFTAVAMWAGPAIAADGKLYPGLMCVQSDSELQDSPVSKNVRYDSKGGVSITLPQHEKRGLYLSVSCPILKDEHKAGKGIAKIRVYYTSNHPQFKFSCSVYTRKHEELISKGEGINNLRRVGQVGPHTTSIIEIPGPQTAHSDGYYYLRCGIPKKTGFGESVLHAYYVEER